MHSPDGHLGYLPYPRKFFRRAIPTSFFPMSCSSSRIFLSYPFSWVPSAKRERPLLSNSSLYL